MERLLSYLGLFITNNSPRWSHPIKVKFKLGFFSYFWKDLNCKRGVDVNLPWLLVLATTEPAMANL